MCERIFATLTLAFSVLVVFLWAVKGLGTGVDASLVSLGLLALSISLPLAGFFLIWESLKEKRPLQLVLVSLPLAAFALAFVLSSVSLTFPAPVLVLFDFYLILGLSFYLGLSLTRGPKKPQTIHF